MGQGWLNLLLGFVVLLAGAEVLVRGSAALARRFGVGPLVVGLTVVAFGTSAPELAVSARAALAGQGDIALGNVVGSNIANILLILGLAAMIRPLAVHHKVVRIDIPLMIGVTVLILPILANGTVGRLEGAVLLVGIVAYTWFSVRLARRENHAEAGPQGGGAVWPAGVSVFAVAAGLAALVFGAGRFVDGAVVIAGALGVSQAVIGLTVVAVGTSLPELATSLLAAARGESDIAVGNIVGSNLFNLLGILGASATLQPLSFTGVGWTDTLVMLGAALLLLPLARSGSRLNRWEALLFLAAYVAYVLFLAGVWSTAT